MKYYFHVNIHFSGGDHSIFIPLAKYMIPADSFRENWPLVFRKRNSFSEKGLAPFGLPAAINQFLLEFGLPDDLQGRGAK
jgi:hypothetical protein